MRTPHPPNPGDEPGTRPLSRLFTGRLGTSRLRRTVPFKLRELSAGPANFSERRFSPHSQVIALAGGLELELIDEPGSSLGAAKPLVFAEILRLTAENTPYHPGTYMHAHLDQATLLTIVRLDGVPSGFAIASLRPIDGRQFLFFNATMTAPSVRGGGLTTRLSLIAFWRAVRQSKGRPFYAAMRTQNPLVLAAAVSAGPFYPRPDRETPRDIRQAAARLSRVLNPKARFDEQAMVQRGVLARDAIDPNRPRHHRADINAMCDERLDYQAGDLLLSVAELRWWHVAALHLAVHAGAALMRLRPGRGGATRT